VQCRPRLVTTYCFFLIALPVVFCAGCGETEVERSQVEPGAVSPAEPEAVSHADPVSPSDFPSEDDRQHDADAIRALIPRAAGLTDEEFAEWMENLEVVRRSPTTPKPAEIEFASPQKSLTVILYVGRPGFLQEGQNEFQYLNPEAAPFPAMLEEMRRKLPEDVSSRDDPVGATLIHADRITDLTCEIEGVTATGTVSFEVPELYRGKVDYVARRDDGAWQITEFAMPAFGVRLVCDEWGTWSKSE